MSGPPATVAQLGNYIFNKYLHNIHIGDCIGQNKGDLPLCQNKTNLKFYQNLVYKFEIVGSLCLEKNCKLKYLKL